jgi:hypothetical protein
MMAHMGRTHLTSRWPRLVMAVLIPALALVTACTPGTTGDGDDGDRPASSAALAAFDGCGGLTSELQRRGLAQLSTNAAGWLAAVGMGAVGVAADGAAAAESSAAPVARAAGDTYSGTNVQEAGVDEPDVVKTDGSSVYTLIDGTLRIVDVRSDRPQVRATLQLDDGAPRELLLHDGRLLLLGDDRLTTAPPIDPSAPAATDESGLAEIPLVVPRTRLWAVDVHDPSAPTVTSTMVVEGAMLTSRLTAGTARVVVRSFPILPNMVQAVGRGAGPADALAANRRLVRTATARDWLPQVTVDGDTSVPLVECTAVRAPGEGEDIGLVSVLSLDLDQADLNADRVDAVLGGADTVYADDDSLYVTTSRWPVMLPVEPVPLPLEPAPAPRPIEPAEQSDALPSDAPASAAPPAATPSPGPPSPGTPTDAQSPTPPPPSTEQPSTDVPDAVPASPPPVTTEVHRFDLDADGATYVASGSVPGTVLNQWALSEHADDLRIATTVDAGPSGASHSAVHVLRREGARLIEVGRTGDLGRGERIYAVRYAGPLGFVVTFRQVDPLYTLDLSDPTAPEVLGELKIPGYSAYLHPIGQDHLLGIGQDATAEGRVQGLQVSLFDLSDRATPERVGTIGLGAQTSSPVEYDHRALLAWPDRDLVALPVERWDAGSSGVLVLTADDGGRLVDRGTIALPTDEEQAGWPVRALVIGERLVVVSGGAVLTADLDSLDVLGSIRL